MGGRPYRTRRARQRAAASVDEIAQTWREGQFIVREGEIVSPLQAVALRDLEALGYDADALVRAVAPRRAVALIRQFAAVAHASDPISCLR